MASGSSNRVEDMDPSLEPLKQCIVNELGIPKGALNQLLLDVGGRLDRYMQDDPRSTDVRPCNYTVAWSRHGMSLLQSVVIPFLSQYPALESLGGDGRIILLARTVSIYVEKYWLSMQEIWGDSEAELKHCQLSNIAIGDETREDAMVSSQAARATNENPQTQQESSSSQGLGGHRPGLNTDQPGSTPDQPGASAASSLPLSHDSGLMLLIQVENPTADHLASNRIMMNDLIDWKDGSPSSVDELIYRLSFTKLKDILESDFDLNGDRYRVARSTPFQPDKLFVVAENGDRYLVKNDRTLHTAINRSVVFDKCRCTTMLIESGQGSAADDGDV